MPPIVPESYLADSSSLIGLFNRKFNVRTLNRLVKDGTFKVPNRVYAEVKGHSDRLGTWIRAHPDCVLKETNQNCAELTRVTREHGDLLTETSSAADAVVVAMGLYFQGSKLVVSDDSGIQLACAREGVTYLPLLAFMRAVEL